MISNTITLRKFFLWNSQWFCDYNYYNLLFEDIKINNYLQSIFKYLKLPTSNFIIKRYVYKLIIQSNIHITFLFNKYLRLNKLTFFIKRHRKLMINHFVFKKSVYFFFKQISILLYYFIYKKKYILNNNILNKLRVKHWYHKHSINISKQKYYFYDKLYWIRNYIKENKLLHIEQGNEDSLNKDIKENNKESLLDNVEKDEVKDNTINKDEHSDDSNFTFYMSSLELNNLFFRKLNFYNKIYSSLYLFYNKNDNIKFKKSITYLKKKHWSNPYEEKKRILSLIKSFKQKSFKKNKKNKKNKKIITWNKLNEKNIYLSTNNNSRFLSIYRNKKRFKRKFIRYWITHKKKYINSYVKISKFLKYSISCINTIYEFIDNYYSIKTTGFLLADIENGRKKKDEDKIEPNSWFYSLIIISLHKYIEIEKQLIYSTYKKMHYLKYLNKYYNNSNTFDNNRFSYNTIYFLKKLKINIFNDIVDIYDYEKYFNNITKNDLSSKQNLVTSSFYHLIHRYKMFYFLKKNIFFKKFENIFKSEKIYGLKINNIKKRNIYKDHLYNIETRRKRLLIEKKKKKLEEKNKVIVIDIEFVCKHWNYYIKKLKLRYYSYYIYNKYFYIQKYSNFITIFKPLFNYYLINYRIYSLFKRFKRLKKQKYISNIIQKKKKYILKKIQMNNSIKQNKLHFKKKNNIYSFNYTSVKGRTLLSMLTENHSLSDYDILHKPIKYNFLLTDKPKIIKSVRLLKNKLIINKRKILKKNIIKKNKKKIKRYKKLLKKKIKRYKKLFKKKIKKLKNVNKNSLFFRLCKKINYVKTFKFFKRFFKRVSFLKSKNLFNNKGHIKRGIITIKKKRKILIKKDDNRNHKCFYHSKYDLWNNKKKNILINKSHNRKNNFFSKTKYFSKNKINNSMKDKQLKTKYFNKKQTMYNIRKKKKFIQITTNRRNKKIFLHNLLKKSYNYFFIFYKHNFNIYHINIFYKTKILNNYNYIKTLNYCFNNKYYFTYSINNEINVLINKNYLFFIKKYLKNVKKYKKIINRFKKTNIISFIKNIIKKNIFYNNILFTYLKLISIKHFYNIFVHYNNNIQFYKTNKNILNNIVTFYSKYKLFSKINICKKYLFLNKKYFLVKAYQKKHKYKKKYIYKKVKKNNKIIIYYKFKRHINQHKVLKKHNKLKKNKNNRKNRIIRKNRILRKNRIHNKINHKKYKKIYFKNKKSNRINKKKNKKKNKKTYFKKKRINRINKKNNIKKYKKIYIKNKNKINSINKKKHIKKANYINIYKKDSFLFRYIYFYYLYHKNIYFNYIMNTISIFLFNKSSNRLNTIKKNIHYNNNNNNLLEHDNKIDYEILKKNVTITNKIRVSNDLFIDNKIKFLNYRHNSSIFFYNIIENDLINKWDHLVSNKNTHYYILRAYNYYRKENKDLKTYFSDEKRDKFLSYYNNFFISYKENNNKIINFFNLSTRNQFFFHWFFKRYIYNYINNFFFILKYLLYIFLKSYTFFLNKNDNKTSLLNSLFNSLNNNEIVNCINRNETITGFYLHFIKKTYYINYIENTILLYLFQNKSLHHYYINYYILNFWYLFYYMELTIGHYSNINCYLFMTYSLKRNYYLNSAKMWCEYITYQLEKKIKIRKIFWYIKKQQVKEARDREYLESVNDLAQQKILFAKYPLKGIRILYSGNFKKANRKKRLFYYLWFSDVRYTGRMPLKQYKFYIDYYYSLAILRRSSVGIKFWLLFDIY